MYINATISSITFMALLCLCMSCNKNQTHPGHESHAGYHGSMPGSTYAEQVNLGRITHDTMKSSPRRYSMLSLARVHLHISYSSPGVKGRVIWGGLVPYGQVWASGAHSATTLDINRPVIVMEKKLPPGKYALFTIPGEKKWTVILNRDWDQHLTDNYDPNLDEARFEVIPDTANRLVQRLTYTVEATGEYSGVISLEWENIKLSLRFSVEE